MLSVQVFIGVPAVLVLIAAFLVVMPVVDNPQVRKEQTPNRWILNFDDDDALKGEKATTHSLPPPFSQGKQQ